MKRCTEQVASRRRASIVRAALLVAAAVGAVTIPGVASVAAQEPPPGAPPREHVVRAGDTLWDLARAYLRDPFLWPLLFQANRALLADPDLIFPAQRLVIPEVPPVSPAAAPPARAPVGEPVEDPPAMGPPSAAVAGAAEPPGTDTAAAASSPAEEPLAVRPGEYATAPWLADPGGLPLVGRIVGMADGVPGDERLPSTLHPWDRVLVGQLHGVAPAPGDTLTVVRLGHAPDGWGRTVVPMAMLRVDTVAGDVFGARVVAQYADARVGDQVLLPGARPALPRGAPTAVTDGPAGTLLAFVEPRGAQSRLDIGFVDLGAAHGVAPGDELEAYTAPTDGAPSVPLARLRVIRVEPGSATVMVEAIHALGLHAGLPVRLVGRVR